MDVSNLLSSVTNLGSGFRSIYADLQAGYLLPALESGHNGHSELVTHDTAMNKWTPDNGLSY